MTYLETIITGLFLFPFLAAVITLPYIAFQYRKYGSVSKYRTMIIYSLWLFTDFPMLAAAGLPHLFKDIPGVIIIALKVVSVAYIVVYMVNSIFRKKSFVMPHDKFSKTFYSAIAVKGNGEG